MICFHADRMSGNNREGECLSCVWSWCRLVMTVAMVWCFDSLRKIIRDFSIQLIVSKLMTLRKLEPFCSGFIVIRIPRTLTSITPPRLNKIVMNNMSLDDKLDENAVSIIIPTTSSLIMNQALLLASPSKHQKSFRINQPRQRLFVGLIEIRDIAKLTKARKSDEISFS